MNAKEFYETVVKMRKAQREYFATRSSGALMRSKELEAEVDREIKRVEDRTEQERHPTLFPEF